MLKKLELKAKTYLRNIYANLLCPQRCLFCSNEVHSGLPLCSDCLHREIIEPVNFRLNNEERFCKSCGRLLISEKEYCTQCRARIATNGNINGENKKECIMPQICDKIFSLFPYQGQAGNLLTHWKNCNVRSLAEPFAKAVFEFIYAKPELQNIKIVPVPPRPKKIKNKGWDQIEDLAEQLEQIYGLGISRCLKRKDGTSQKSLSREKRKTNLKGKIFLRNQHKVLPETLIILDDVMTTGATLNFCASELKKGGCKKVYGLCLFFD